MIFLAYPDVHSGQVVNTVSIKSCLTSVIASLNSVHDSMRNVLGGPLSIGLETLKGKFSSWEENIIKFHSWHIYGHYLDELNKIELAAEVLHTICLTVKSSLNL